MSPAAVALRDGYEDLRLPITIIAGDGDRVVFKRRSARLAATIPGSVLRTVAGAGHMVHHPAPAKVVGAIEEMAAAVAGAPLPALAA